ncbi:unnamed protein product, partial [Linum tenue]
QEFILNSRGSKLFTCKWVPANEEPKALIFLCHGYAMECSITMNPGTAMRLAKQGYGVYGIDYEGHGKSSGLQGYIQNLDSVVQDCAQHFRNISGWGEKTEDKRGKKRYLMGESLGGAVTLLLHRTMPNFWDGAILVAPMCKVRMPLPHYRNYDNILLIAFILLELFGEKDINIIIVNLVFCYGGEVSLVEAFA